MGLPQLPVPSPQRQEIEDRLRARLSALETAPVAPPWVGLPYVESSLPTGAPRSRLRLAALLVLCPCPIDHATGAILTPSSLSRTEHPPRGRTLLWLTVVLVLSLLGAGVELWGGHAAGSKAVLVDGWHMAMHVLAIAVSFALLFWRTAGRRVQTFVTAFNAVLLGGAGIFTLFEAAKSLVSVEVVDFETGLAAGVVGLAVNAACAAIFRAKFDLAKPALRSAYLHVLADVVTSVLALVAVLASPWSYLRLLDPILGILGGLVILLWAVTLARQLRKPSRI
jgi:Co/Zn/Cd efflux system component